MASWEEFLTDTEPGEHLVQLYGQDDQSLTRNVSRYLLEGLRCGDGLLVIATPEHTRAIARQLVQEEPEAAPEAERSQRLRYLDARETLASLLAHGLEELEWPRATLGAHLASARALGTSGSVRAFGEMVGLLWNEGRREDAIRLERLWNTLLAEHDCSLYCAYGIDLFRGEADVAALQRIVGSHHHVLAGAGTLLSGGRARL